MAKLGYFGQHLPNSPGDTSYSTYFLGIGAEVSFFCSYFLLGVGTFFAAAAAKSLQSCPTLCDPVDGSSREWKGFQHCAKARGREEHHSLWEPRAVRGDWRKGRSSTADHCCRRLPLPACVTREPSEKLSFSETLTHLADCRQGSTGAPGRASSGEQRP